MIIFKALPFTAQMNHPGQKSALGATVNRQKVPKYIIRQTHSFQSLVHAYGTTYVFGHYLLTDSAYISATIKNTLIPSLLHRSYLVTVPLLCGP